MTPTPNDTSPFSPTALQLVIDYIEEHLFEELTPGMIASHFFVST